jgi:hypothetical protein
MQNGLVEGLNDANLTAKILICVWFGLLLYLLILFIYITFF